MRKSMEDRFWSKVDQSDGCWMWMAHRERGGYGTFRLGARKVKAHRLSYELTLGPITPGMELDHICHNRGCVNPSHLREATRKQNQENIGLASNNTSGVRGVYWCKASEKWKAHLKHHGQPIHVGCYANLADAEAAVIAKRNELYTHNDFDRAA